MANEDGQVIVKPSSLPSYREMILKAIDGRNEENGSNKTSIAKYIESTYGELLPPGHKVLLNVHLAKMRDSGELVFWKNNYTKRDINAPPRPRGRGRPPKPKEQGAVVESPRPRGRPAKDPNAPPSSPKVKASGGSGRPRGRPRKTAQPGEALPVPAGSGRPRGRPPKMQCTLTEISA
ncbi:HMG-Y-related protein A-like [Lotus japonicus]|uniref:HMG-Y-related protein A-like n=1 Tax=Lotus japonicus TaxID=34305 RepID=UPI0025907A3C|nr:HMG-Y-related protein A-like [Lotus japonicus]